MGLREPISDWTTNRNAVCDRCTADRRELDSAYVGLGQYEATSVTKRTEPAPSGLTVVSSSPSS
jgi:hypothetical protein